MLYSIDQPPEGLDGVKLDSLTLQSTDLRLSSEKLNATYEGKLSVDGDSIAGTRTGRNPFRRDRLGSCQARKSIF